MRRRRALAPRQLYHYIDVRLFYSSALLHESTTWAHIGCRVGDHTVGEGEEHRLRASHLGRKRHLAHLARARVG